MHKSPMQMTIVEELRNDRESGARRLESEYKAGLMILARRLYADPSDAEELVNRTFAAVVEGIDGFLEQSSLFTWMCRILNHIYSMDCRRKSHQMVVCQGDLPDIEDDGALEEVYRNLDASLVRDAIDLLPPDQRETLLLHYFMDIPVAKMAKILAVPAGTIHSRLHYARKALAAKLGVKAHEMARKPGAKAFLVAFALVAITAAGAAIAGARAARTQDTKAGEPSALRQSADEPSALRQNTPQSKSGATKGAGWSGETIVSDAASTSPVASVLLDLSRFNSLSHNPTKQAESTMNNTKPLVGPLAALALAAAPPTVTADNYQYMISGDPVAAATEGTSYGVSSGTSLAVGELGDVSEADALEARRRTSDESPGTALNSTKASGFTLIIR